MYAESEQGYDIFYYPSVQTCCLILSAQANESLGFQEPNVLKVARIGPKLGFPKNNNKNSY